MFLKNKNFFGKLVIYIILFSSCLFLFRVSSEKLSDYYHIHDTSTKVEPKVSVLEETSVKEERVQQLAKVENATATTTVRVPIFVYHSVRPHILNESALQDAYDVTPELFEQQLMYLKNNNYEVITMEALYNMMKKGRDVSDTKKKVVLTFDDGWENQYKYAFPILKKYGVSAMFYVYTRPIGYKHFLTWEQLREMKHSGMEIGSHTITHPFFKKSDEKSLRFEIIESKKVLEEKLSIPINHFAAPFGYSNEHIESIIKEAGYETGRTIYRGPHQSNPYSLRGDLLTDSMKDFINALEQK